MMDGMLATGPDQESGWGGSPAMRYRQYEEWLKDPKYPNQKVVIQTGAVKKLGERQKKYFKYLRRTAEFRPKAPRGDKVAEFLKKQASGEQMEHMFYSDTEVKKYKQDWILNLKDADEDLGND